MTKQEHQNQDSTDQKAKEATVQSSISQKQNFSSQVQQKLKSEIEPKKKIIKKFPFTSKTASNQKEASKNDQDLKDWKPTSLNASKAGSSTIKQEAPKKRNEIFNQFLSNLPKPKQKDIEPEPINLISQNGAKKSHKQIFIKPTEEQLKWDAQDQFLTKNAETYNKKNIEEKMERPSTSVENAIGEEVEDNEVVEKIVWLNEEKTGKKLNIADIVSKTWEKQANQLDDDFDSDENSGNKKKAFPKSGNLSFKSKPF